MLNILASLPDPDNYQGDYYKVIDIDNLRPLLSRQLFPNEEDRTKEITFRKVRSEHKTVMDWEFDDIEIGGNRV